MTIHADDEPIILLTSDDQREVVEWLEELRPLVVRVEIDQPDGGGVPEVIYVGEPRLDPRRDGVRWSITRTNTGVWVDDHRTNERHGPSTMREAMALVRGMIDAETAALIAAIPLLRLPDLPMLGK